ncbi:helicase-related protein, partial [Escherichia coli]|uniref:helicase-related protein n=1 Tax=Escherichia coli TaxID=562 RepID=UPI003C048109
EGGQREVRITPAPDGYKEYQQELQRRITAIRQRKGPPKKGEDIILRVIGDGRFSAIDMRFVDPSRANDPGSKLNQMLDAVIEDYHAMADHEYFDTVTGKPDPIKGASHLIFTDIGLGEQSAASRGFDMRRWIEKRLTDGGVPADHIAFMRDYKQHAKKERLFADMREGKKRVLIGGKEMETGTNVQKRLMTEDHLDAPWFPSSVEQREGRIVRQGNQNKQVRIRAWATKGSYDSTMWGMNARK